MTTIFCGLGSFARLGISQPCLFSELWSAILAKAQAHDSQVALFSPLILFCDLNISERVLTFGEFIVPLLFQFVPVCTVLRQQENVHVSPPFLLNMLFRACVFQRNISYFSCLFLLLLE